jgi:2-polyprenyl-6-methoxyphenol hydroxylase-like FAD-dependent oxidoreductase
MSNTPLIVGAGPTGLSAALFLSRKGVLSRVIDQAREPATQSRAQVINPRSLELLEPTGVVDAMLAEGHGIHGARFYDEQWKPIAELELGKAHPRFGMTVLPQACTERLLAQALEERGLQPERGVRLESLAQDTTGVTAMLVHADSEREVARAPLLLGVDGAHSHVREALGVGFEGSGFPESWPLYDIHLNDPLDLNIAHIAFVESGLVFLLGIRPGLWRVLTNVPNPLEWLPSNTQRGEVSWQSSFHISHRLATRETIGHVALAGDAAHIHSPVAARGMNLGIEDAYVFADCAADALNDHWDRLDDFGRLRHEVHAKVVGRVRALTTLARGRSSFVRTMRRHVIPAIIKFPPAAHAMVGLLTGLDHDVKCH